MRVVELSSSSTRSARDRRKSLKDLNPNAFSENDGSIRFIWAFTVELCSHSTSSFSRPICSARVNSAVAAACASGCSGSADLVRLAAGLLRLARRLEARHPGQRVVDDELVARRRQGLARRAGHPDAHHVAAQPLAPLRQRDVVGVAGHDHHMREVGKPEHVLDRVDRQPDVGGVLAVGRRGEQLHQVDRAGHQLAAVLGVDVGRPVGIRARQHHRAERGREVQHRADVHPGPRQLCRLETFGLVTLKRVAAVDLVVPRDHDVVEVEIHRNAGRTGIGHVLKSCPCCDEARAFAENVPVTRPSMIQGPHPFGWVSRREWPTFCGVIRCL